MTVPVPETTSPISGSVGTTHTSIGVSSGVVTVTSGTTGGSLTGVIVTITVAVSQSAGINALQIT